ncbi:MAG: SO_0444 family Cu/Zn efflux transporter [Desulfobacterales bacterium]|jgi:uncharacterized protein|nr:SO_0444 family Cu/Zn efflux transporter [Desulfobacterales bacterium]
MTNFIINSLMSTWDLLMDSSVYMIAGLIFSGIIHVFLSPDTISNHLGKGRFISVIKAAVLGIPLPLCSCGVLPTAVSLKKQGANNGATTAFLISTPESGVDSISVTYALLDPIMTIARPVAAFIMATIAGMTENLFNYSEGKNIVTPDMPDIPDNPGCCTDNDGCLSKAEENTSFIKKITSGIRYAFTDVWDDMAGWFFIGLLIAGIITALIPEELINRHLGGGLSSMLLMLIVGIPLYICATASTPVAAALIMKGVSPGAALVFLLAGPATNITSLTVLTGILGKRTTAIYLGSIGLFSIIFGLLVDKIYLLMNISPQAIVGSASEIIPPMFQLAGVIVLLCISIKPLTGNIKSVLIQNIKRMSRNRKNTESGENSDDITSRTGST